MIDFQFEGIDFALDTDKGELLGDKSTAQYRRLLDILGDVSVYQSGEVISSVGGEPWLPFEYTDITNPYKHPDQFATLLAVALQNDFPDELAKFVNIAKIDNSPLLEVQY